MEDRHHQTCAAALKTMRALADTPGLSHFTISWWDSFSGHTEEKNYIPSNLPDSIELPFEFIGLYLDGSFPLLKASPNDTLSDAFRHLRAKAGLSAVACVFENSSFEFHRNGRPSVGRVLISFPLYD